MVMSPDRQVVRVALAAAQRRRVTALLLGELTAAVDAAVRRGDDVDVLAEALAERVHVLALPRALGPLVRVEDDAEHRGDDPLDAGVVEQLPR